MLELNKVFLIGNLTRDPETRYIPSGAAVCAMDLASNRRYKNKEGEQKEDTLFVRVETWGRTAEFCQEYLQKGRRVFVEGRLRMESWEGKDGNRRTRILVVGERVQFADPKPATAAEGPPAPAEEASSRDTEPTAQQPSPANSQVDDDLPF